MSVRINVFRDSTEWYAARWIDGEYDGCDSLDIDDSATAAQAAAAALAMPLSSDGEREVASVADV